MSYIRDLTVHHVRYIDGVMIPVHWICFDDAVYMMNILMLCCRCEKAKQPVTKKPSACWLPHLSRTLFTSLAPGRFEKKFRLVIFKLISVTDGWGISCKIGLRWMPLYLTDDKSTLVQVMAWCRQATSHYLSQCWPRFMSPCCVTRPQWVNAYNMLS